MNFHFSYFHFLYNLLKGVLMSVLLLTVSSHRALTSPEGLRHWAWCRQLLWSLEQDRPWCLLSVAGAFLCNPVILVSTTFYNSLFEIFLIMIKLNTFISKAVSLSFDTYILKVVSIRQVPQRTCISSREYISRHHLASHPKEVKYEATDGVGIKSENFMWKGGWGVANLDQESNK